MGMSIYSSVDVPMDPDRVGVEREMRIMYQQPHLVPPMKLTVFDELPRTPVPPPPSQLSQWMSQGRNLASRASSLSIRRKTSSRPVISSPQPLMRPAQDLPLRRVQEWRPLELSIYMPHNRLSDLPEFDRLSFTDSGELKCPPRALHRTKSEEFVPTPASVVPVRQKPASMFESRRLSHMHRDTSSTVIATSRPPSEYDALHSHPVSWASFPGVPPHIHMVGRPENSVTVLSPMQEEFTPPVTSVTVDSTVLRFPSVDLQSDTTITTPPTGLLLSPQTSAPLPVVSTGPRDLSKFTSHVPAPYFHTNYHTQRRISQWLANRSPSSSISTMKSSPTSSSFADHRRKRSQFYQLSPHVGPPQPLNLHRPRHQRTVTASTVASTLNTDALSSDHPNQSDASMTTAPEIQTRSGMAKTTTASIGLKPIVSGVPDLPPCYTDVVVPQGEEKFVIEEIGGPPRSPGVGIAF